jgi:hypothetical protein
MRVSEFHRRIHLLIGDENLRDGELDYPLWLTVKRGIYKLLAEAGSESRCAHPEPLYDGIICITCGRKPNERNTLA